jgi:cyclohexanecarboxylate-CoA ligase
LIVHLIYAPLGSRQQREYLASRVTPPYAARHFKRHGNVIFAYEAEMKQQGLGEILPAARIEAMVSAGLWRNEKWFAFFEESVRRCPDKLAIVSFNSVQQKTERLTYADLDVAVARLVLAMEDLGISAGSVVSVQLPSWWQFIAVMLACARLGSAINPIMPTARQQDLRHALGLTGSRLLFVPKVFRNIRYQELIDEIRNDLPELQHVVVVDGIGLDSFHGLPEPNATRPTDPLPAPHDPNSVAEVIFTSGTTGEPKGVMHTWNTLIVSTRGFAERLELSSQDVIFMGSPLAHQTGFLWGSVLPVFLGATVVLLDIWNPERAVALIAQEKATFSVAAPTFLTDILAVHEKGNVQVSSLRIFLLAGAPVPRVLVELAAKKLGVSIASAWGMTEVALPTITRPTDSVDKVAGSDGTPLDGTEIRIVGPNGDISGIGQEGRLEARGAFNFVGYLKRPELYATDRDGWFDTGDLAFIDGDGYVRITGRTKDIVIRGGENIPVVEVENALYRHPAIADVAVIATPDPRLGERACACVTLKEGATLGFEEMVAFLGEAGLTKTYFPERLEVINEMPRTASGKIQKYQLRSRFEKPVASMR